MRSIRQLLFGLVCAGALLGPLKPALALNVDATTFTLANGMQVVVIPDHRAPVVTHMVWYKAGSADEPYGEAGIAHFLEHLMFKGTVKYPPGAFNQLMRKNGAEDNAFTTKDYTAYFQRIAKDRLDLVMDVEADRMQNLQLSDQVVIPERDVILEERRERTDNEPSSLLAEQMDAAMFTAHPYGKPIIGWRTEMEQLDRQDAIAFYRAHYTPANAVLVVAGDVTPAEVKALAEKRYGILKNTFEAVARERPKEPEPIAARRVTLTDPRAAGPMLQRNYLAPSYAKADGRAAEALDVLGEVLGDGTTSLLYRKLVVDKKLASQAGAWYSGEALDYGSFGVYAMPNPGGDVAKLEAALDGVLDEVVKAGISLEDLARAKNEIDAETVYALDNQSSLARLFGIALTTGSTVEDVLGWSQRVQAVTVEDVKAAAAKVLDIRRSVTGVLLPAGPLAAEAAPLPAPLPTASDAVQN